MSKKTLGTGLVGCCAVFFVYAFVWCAAATIAMVPIHHAISTGLLMAGKDPRFSWGAAWCIGLFPPCLPLSIVACIALFVFGLFA